MEALNEKQKEAVVSVLADRDHFVTSTANKGKVRKISRDNPFYALSVRSGLRIIYSRVGENIIVMDLMRQATLDRYGERKAKATGSKKDGATVHLKKAK